MILMASKIVEDENSSKSKPEKDVQSHNVSSSSEFELREEVASWLLEVAKLFNILDVSHCGFLSVDQVSFLCWAMALEDRGSTAHFIWQFHSMTAKSWELTQEISKHANDADETQPAGSSSPSPTIEEKALRHFLAFHTVDREQIIALRDRVASLQSAWIEALPTSAGQTLWDLALRDPLALQPPERSLEDPSLLRAVDLHAFLSASPFVRGRRSLVAAGSVLDRVAIAPLRDSLPPPQPNSSSRHHDQDRILRAEQLWSVALDVYTRFCQIFGGDGHRAQLADPSLATVFGTLVRYEELWRLLCGAVQRSKAKPTKPHPHSSAPRPAPSSLHSHSPLQLQPTATSFSREHTRRSRSFDEPAHDRDHHIEALRHIVTPLQRRSQSLSLLEGHSLLTHAGMELQTPPPSRAGSDSQHTASRLRGLLHNLRSEIAHSLATAAPDSTAAAASASPVSAAPTSEIGNQPTPAANILKAQPHATPEQAPLQ